MQVEPFSRAMRTLQADVMINGRRRDHGFERAFLEVQNSRNLILCVSFQERSEVELYPG